MIAALLCARSSGADGADVPNVILDTDICTDCDDAAALAMLHTLTDRGICRLRAVTVCIDHPQAAPFVDAVNTFYGRPDLPVGVVGSGGVRDTSPFLDRADAIDSATGEPLYPHDLRTQADAADAVTLLRQTLAAADDGSVVVVAIGFATNLAQLLDSPGDATCPLAGPELVQRKVRLLSVMAGDFSSPAGNGNPEYNVRTDRAAAARVAEAWPTPIVYSGFEVGMAVPFPAVSVERDFAWARHHPVATAYRLVAPPPQNRPSWDLTSVLAAVLPDRDYFATSAPGRVDVDARGATSFTVVADGRHRHLLLPDERQTARAVEALVQFTTAPPVACRP